MMFEGKVNWGGVSLAISWLSLRSRKTQKFIYKFELLLWAAYTFSVFRFKLSTELFCFIFIFSCGSPHNK